jgi:hypothetical protein
MKPIRKQTAAAAAPAVGTADLSDLSDPSASWSGTPGNREWPRRAAARPTGMPAAPVNKDDENRL